MWRMGNRKVVVSGRYSLWGNGTSGPMLGVRPLIEALTAMPRDPTSADGYSIVPVHAQVAKVGCPALAASDGA